ncbi:jouberin-like [Daphnia carinata]|uniref:jouberin-like n=1 Tax=Daphnia carinata TaxID=120202 RepID=UPI00257E6EF7|nr:jouberin-like [Daphnia carinata]
MKSDDKFKSSSPSPISVLESTRKDFEALLVSTNSSSEEDEVKQAKQRNQTRRQRFKKQAKHCNSVKEHVELHELPSRQHKAKESAQQGIVQVKSSHNNPAFWYEDEQQHERSSNSSSSSPTKSDNVTEVKCHVTSPIMVQSSRNPGEVAKNDSPISNDVSSDNENSEQILSVATAASQSRTSLLSSSSVKSYAKGKSQKTQQTPQHPIGESPCSSLNHPDTEVMSDCEPTVGSLPSVHSVLKLIVHQCERLILDQPTSQPLVVVHAVSCKTGRYVLNNKVPIPPQFTGAWIHQAFSSNTLPEWNQEMTFELDADKHLSEMIFLFELLNEPNTNVSSLLAWGFLRPISRIGVKHLNKKIQLQLYKVPFRRLFHQPSRPNISDLFNWFSSTQKEKYPATLYVTLVSSKTSDFPAIKEENRFSVASPLRGGRLSGQAFKLPTRRSFTYEASAGALMACYRSDGSFLAIALTNGDILIYQNSTISLYLKGHHGNVYDLHWNTNDRGQGWRLLSCGSDCTARVWNDTNDVVLPHPAYVYCARFGDSDRIVTGCFDQIIRLWELNSLSPQLIGTYMQHAAPINSLCWDSDGRLFSADAIGSICIWNFDHSGLRFERVLNESTDEYCNQTPINCLSFHPSGGRLLVHYRGNKICLLDPKAGRHLVSYTGIYNPRLRLISSISPCGGFVVSGSEDGSVHWFDLERGDLVAVASLHTSRAHPIMAVAFHPSNHIVAVCSLSSDCCFTLLEFNQADSDTQGFSITTFPRTVQSAVSPIGNGFRKNSLIRRENCTPTLDKLGRIFRKLDLVLAWSESHKTSLENEDCI